MSIRIAILGIIPLLVACTTANKLVNTQQIQSDTTEFVDDEWGVSFRYPAEWPTPSRGKKGYSDDWSADRLNVGPLNETLADGAPAFPVTIFRKTDLESMHENLNNSLQQDETTVLVDRTENGIKKMITREYGFCTFLIGWIETADIAYRIDGFCAGDEEDTQKEFFDLVESFRIME